MAQAASAPGPEIEPDGDGGPRMSMVEHLNELRRRILVSLTAWAAGSACGWYLTGPVLSYIKSFPSLKDVSLILIRPPEAFFVRFKTAMVIGLILALPVLIFQVMAFVLPGLKKGEKRWALLLIPSSIALFYGGGAFAIFVMVPISLQFFLVNMTKGIALPQISLEEYVNFLIAMVLMGGLAFQTPVVIFFLTVIGVLDSAKLAKYRRHGVILILIIAAVASPPDVFSQLLVAAPMLLLYEVCILVARAAGK